MKYGAKKRVTTAEKSASQYGLSPSRAGTCILPSNVDPPTSPQHLLEKLSGENAGGQLALVGSCLQLKGRPLSQEFLPL